MNHRWLLVVVVAASSICTWSASPASALPPFWKEFEAKFIKPGSADEKEKAFAAIAADENTGKCNICHIKGAKKTMRNSFGAELDKLVDKENFKDERLKAELDKVKAEIIAALDKVVAQKSNAADEKSPTFAQIIAEGKLPGGVPAPVAAAPAPAAPAPAPMPLSPAAQEAVGKIQAIGGTVRVVAMNDDSLEVDFHLGGTKLTDDGLALVKGLPKVVELHLKDTQITDAGLAHIAAMTTLLRLHLEQTKVTDAGLANIKGLTSLVYLNLYNTGITDAGLEHLKGLTNLKSVYLFGSKVTDDGVGKLKQALPNLQIVR